MDDPFGCLQGVKISSKMMQEILQKRNELHLCPFYGHKKKLQHVKIKKLQHVQNAAARLITLSRKHEHITPILLNLHWLPVNYRIIFKILLITYKALNDLAPTYVRDLLTPYTPPRQLRSSSKDLLSIPHFNLKTYGARSFSVAAPTLWNTLPSDIKNSSSVSLFKHKLKTFLFKKAFL